MKAKRMLVLLLAIVCGGVALADAPLPKGLIPVPEEPQIQVSLRTSRTSYEPGGYLQMTFALNREAYVYVYNVTSAGKVQLLVPNVFLQEPHFPAGEHTLPKEGWRLRVTEPEGWEYLQIVATPVPLDFYEAKAFEERPFLEFADPEAFATRLKGLVGDTWGTAWAMYRVHVPRALVRVFSQPSGAEVIADGVRLGTTPLETTVRAGRTTVELRKPGYESKRVSLNLVDGEEADVVARLTPERPRPPARVEVDLSLGLGFALGLSSLGLELWAPAVGAGVAAHLPPERPDLGAPGPGGTYPWGPEVELYLGGWVGVGDRAGLVLLGGLAVQEVVDLPPWDPQAVRPAVVIEPDTRMVSYPAFGLGLGIAGDNLRGYLAWHNRRGIVLAATFMP